MNKINKIFLLTMLFIMWFSFTLVLYEVLSDYFLYRVIITIPITIAAINITELIIKRK